VNAPLDKVAQVVGADIVVVAVESGCGHAFSSLTRITHGARVAVIALGVVIYVGEPVGRVAGVVGAWVFIVAGGGRAGRAFPGLAVVAEGAEVAVVARHAVEPVETALKWCAGIVGAKVAVIAIRDIVRDTGTA